MPLSDADFVQENSGTTASGTSHAVTLPSGTTAGNTIVVAITTVGASPASTGFVMAKSQVNTYVLYLSEVAAAQTSWTFTTSGAAQVAWYAAEISNLDPAEPVDATAGVTSGALSNGGTASTGTTALNAGLYSVALAVFGINYTSSSWSDYTNGFTEVADVSGGGPTMAVARLFESSTTRTFESTATLATSSSGLAAYSVMVVFKAADSPIVAPLAHIMGLEQGTHGGTNVNGSISPFGGPLGPTGTWGTNYLIQAGSARNSGYGLRIVQTGAAAFVRCGSVTRQSGSAGFNVRVVSATGTVVVAEIADNAATVGYAQLMYDSSATKFGVRCKSTGTTSWESGTTALNTWRWVDLRVKTTTTTWHADWRIETAADTYTDQAAAEITGQTAGLSFHCLNLGANTAQTMTADFDDVVLSNYYAAYPLGPHEVRLLTVDPAGTPSVSGTTANFKVVTANGTLGNWDPAGARSAVDEVPVTISTASDAVAQVTAAASEYMEFPMATYTLGATEFINGVRMLAAIGSGTGAGAGDAAIRGYDGTAETALATVSQLTPGSPTAISSTVPLWRCAMWQSINGWTQAELDAAVTRFGFSGDATPDMWLHAIYLEVAVGKTRRQALFGTMATAEVDPTRLGKVSVTVDAPVTGTGGTTLEYETGGSPITVPVAEGTTATEQINAVFDADASRITLYWPPEPAPGA